MAVDAATGRVLWRKSDADTRELMPTTLAVGKDRVFFQNADHILCLDAQSGDEVWRTGRPVSRRRYRSSRFTFVEIMIVVAVLAILVVAVLLRGRLDERDGG